MPPFEPFPKMEVIRDPDEIQKHAAAVYNLSCDFCSSEGTIMTIADAVDYGWAVVVDNGKKRLSCPDCTNGEE